MFQRPKKSEESHTKEHIREKSQSCVVSLWACRPVPCKWPVVCVTNVRLSENRNSLPLVFQGKPQGYVEFDMCPGVDAGLENSHVWVPRLLETSVESFLHTSSYMILVIEQLDQSESIFFLLSAHHRDGQIGKEGCSWRNHLRAKKLIGQKKKEFKGTFIWWKKVWKSI